MHEARTIGGDYISEAFYVSTVHIFIKSIFIPYTAPAYTVSFTQSTYSVGESSGPVMVTLALSYPALTDVTVAVFTANGSATGTDSHVYSFSRYII